MFLEMQVENLIFMYCSKSSEYDCVGVVMFLGFKIKLFERLLYQLSMGITVAKCKQTVLVKMLLS